MSELKIFSGRANQPLSEKISQYLGESLGDVEIKDFSDDDTWVNYRQNIRGADVFIVQPTNGPAKNREELFIMLHTAKMAWASRIIAVLPYYGYSRQDRKDRSRSPITAKLMADLITISGASGVVTVDLHASQIQGFFNIPLTHLYARPVLLRHLQEQNLGNNLVVVAPDVGASKMARSYAQRLNNVPIAIVDKRRPEHNRAEVVNIVGEVEGLDALYVDDIIDTADSLTEVCKALKKKGANNIYAFATHGVLSGRAIQRIDAAPVSKLFITDTIHQNFGKLLNKKIEIVSIAPLLGEAIRRIHNNESVSSLFE